MALDSYYGKMHLMHLTKWVFQLSKHEEWKYTRISGLFNKEYQFPADQLATSFSAADMDAVRLPGHEEANELVFVNGVFSFSLSIYPF